MAEQRNFLGETPDQRRNRRRKLLIESALDLTFEGGFAAVGVRSVSQKAGLSTRYFYESFTGVDDLLILMMRDLYQALMIPGLAALHSFDMSRAKALSDDEIFTLLYNGLSVALSVVLSDPRQVAFIAAANASNGEVRQEFKRIVASLVEVIDKDPVAQDLGVDHLAASFVAAGVVELMVAFVSGELNMDRETLVKRIALMTLRVFKVA